MFLGVADFFQFSAVCLQFSAVCLQFPKKSATLQTHFGLYNMGSNIHSFWTMAIWNEKFWFGSPCITNQNLLIQMAITLITCISDPILVTKMRFGGLQLFIKIVNNRLKNDNKCRPPKHILALPTWGQNAYFQKFSH